jgi:hypothetical protein
MGGGGVGGEKTEIVHTIGALFLGATHVYRFFPPVGGRKSHEYCLHFLARLERHI